MGDGQPRLLDQIRDRLRRKHYSIRGYVDWIWRFVNRLVEQDALTIVVSSQGRHRPGV